MHENRHENYFLTAQVSCYAVIIIIIIISHVSVVWRKAIVFTRTCRCARYTNLSPASVEPHNKHYLLYSRCATVSSASVSISQALASSLTLRQRICPTIAQFYFWFLKVKFGSNIVLYKSCSFSKHLLPSSSMRMRLPNWSLLGKTVRVLWSKMFLFLLGTSPSYILLCFCLYS